VKEERKPTQVKSVWEYYGTDKGILEFAERFNLSEHNANGNRLTSPPLQKIKYQESQIALKFIVIISLILMLISSLVWHFCKGSMLKLEGEGMASINDLLIGTVFVILLVLSVLLMIIAIGASGREDRKNLRKYIEKFEKLGGKFANLILANSSAELSIYKRCDWVLRLKAESVLTDQTETKKLRDEINEIIDIMLESGIIDQREVHTLYTRAFKEAQVKIEKQKTALRTP